MPCKVCCKVVVFNPHALTASGMQQPRDLNFPGSLIFVFVVDINFLHMNLDPIELQIVCHMGNSHMPFYV